MILLKKFFVLFLLFLSCADSYSQFTVGTTGLLNMPTADMQRDKTFMFGGGFLEKHTTPTRWTYNTFNYYINVTIFPWLEVAYDCTLHKGMKYDPAYGEGFWPEQTWGKFTNQDRNFSVRLRLLKEGQLWKYMPSVVIGSNDVTTRPGDGDVNFSNPVGSGNGFWNRYFIAITKHLPVKNIGELGVHVAYLYNRRTDYPLNGPAFGANFHFNLPNRDNLAIKALNGLNLMAEYDARTVNIGAEYSFWKDYINAVVELNRCKHFSGGVVFKVHLK